MYVSVVVPCYRSSVTLPELVSRLDAALAGLDGHEVILVVDGEDDGTWSAAAALQRLSHRVRAMRLSRNYGQHNALVAGIRAARHEVVVTMDDDLQHRPEEIPALLDALTDDIDLVYGVATEEEHGFLRNVTSRLAKAGLERAMRIPGAADTSAFRAFRTFLRDGFTHLRGENACLDVALAWGTTHATSVRVRMDERAYGRSTYTFRSLVRHLLNMVVGYTTAPLRFVTALGFLVGSFGLVLLVRVLYLYATGQSTVAGFTTLVCIVAVFSAAQLVGIGVLGEYVGRIHNHGLGRPTYVVRPTGPEPARSADPVIPAPASGARSSIQTTSHR